MTEKPLADITKVEAYKAWCYLCEGYLLPVLENYLDAFKLASVHISEVHHVKTIQGKVKQARK